MAIGPPARRQPTVASQVLGGSTGRTPDGDGIRRPHPVNHGPELRGSMPGAARRCFLKFSRT
jgi:hypothetical protein